VLFATHDLDAAWELEATSALLCDGVLVASGPARDLLRDEDLLRRAGLALPPGLAARLGKD
jgi:ABC-type multidrug transport system ATPase subunit